MRFATYNASLNRPRAGDLVAELREATEGRLSAQLRAVLAVIEQNQADVLLVNEFDHDPDEEAAQRFASLAGYRNVFTAPSNTGVDSGVDLDNDGEANGPNDAFGFGMHPGQFAMLVLSRYPLVATEARTFQRFLWRDMPGALLPTNPDGTSWYSEAALEVLRLSSKSHWDVPVATEDGPVQVLASHPTPPAFDGPEGRNRARNHDEIRFWADYISEPARSAYIRDDQGGVGGLTADTSFVILGDQNADPQGGDSAGAIAQLLDHRRVNTDMTPASEGAVEASVSRGVHGRDPRYDTADFSPPGSGGPGNLRVDYVLPSRDLRITDAGVFWPPSSDPRSALTGVRPFPSSDHRLVWVDVTATR